MERLLPLGVKTIQLRLKNATPSERQRQISDAVSLANRYNCQLVVNDHWKEAIACGASYLHLGQEDLENADIAAIRSAGISFGISTHTPDELSIALTHQPHYIALGPIYPPTGKQVDFAPQGLSPLSYWKKNIDVPLVAIGGITLEKAQGIIQAGADSIAVIGDVLHHPTPELRAKEWLEWFTSPPSPSKN